MEYDNMKVKDLYLNNYACKDSNAIYLSEITPDMRTPFFRDTDRIIYSLAFNRYSHKTQVFSFKNHDHLSKRMIHVQYVSKIGRTIGRALGLNEDLIEAAALGHDLGHTPFGHFGERVLNDISLENNEGYFNHNIQSVRLLLYIENYGKGLNITLQTLDAIMCHNGEFALGKYYPKEKTIKEFFDEYKKSYTDKGSLKKLKPMTLEGYVVRISDMIAYLGRDIDDARKLRLINREDIPEKITNVLGKTTREIVNNIVLDIINNSKGKNYIELSDEVFESIVELKKFNYENIYEKAYTSEEGQYIENMIRTLYKKYIIDLEENNQDSTINKSYLNFMTEKYKKYNTKERIVLDYIAGMTDEYCASQYEQYINNQKEEV